MKQFYLLFIFCCFAYLKGGAQEMLPDSFTITQNRVFLETGLSQPVFGSTKNPQVVHARFGIKIIPRLYLLGHAGIGLRKEQREGFNNRKVSSIDFGGGLNYRIIQSPVRNWVVFRSLDVHALWASTTNKSDWEYKLYELGLTLGLRGRYTPTIGASYRFYDSRTPGLKNVRGIFGTVGIRL